MGIRDKRMDVSIMKDDVCECIHRQTEEEGIKKKKEKDQTGSEATDGWTHKTIDICWH